MPDPAGPPGCEGAPRPVLRAVRAGGGPGDLFDPAPAVELSAGGNTVPAAGSHVAITTFCEGFTSRVWLAEANGTQLTAVRELPALSPAPTDPFLVTALSGDGRRLLAVHTTGADLAAHRIVAVDTASGVVTDLGVPGYWAGELADGTLVVDQGANLRIGGRTVAVPDQPGAGRFVAVSPDGRRVAWAGLFVVGRDGGLRRWSSDAVTGWPAWSPEGTALAYATGAADALTGPLRVVRAGSPPRTVTDRPPRPGETWSGPVCEGAAGSTYCTWSAPWARLTIRVANEDASLGRDGAVTEVFFDLPDGGVALWPLTTAAEAATTQAQVDQGHSPWMLEPGAVADSFARAELGWTDPVVTVVDPGTVRLTRPGASTAVVLAVAQPARTGPGGIWAVARAGSAEAG